VIKLFEIYDVDTHFYVIEEYYLITSYINFIRIASGGELLNTMLIHKFIHEEDIA
jgi:hypothetical protein